MWERASSAHHCGPSLPLSWGEPKTQPSLQLLGGLCVCQGARRLSAPQRSETKERVTFGWLCCGGKTAGVGSVGLRKRHLGVSSQACDPAEERAGRQPASISIYMDLKLRKCNYKNCWQNLPFKAVLLLQFRYCNSGRT